MFTNRNPQKEGPKKGSVPAQGPKQVPDGVLANPRQVTVLGTYAWVLQQIPTEAGTSGPTIEG